MKVRAWLNELDDGSFDVRAAADKKLAALGDHIEQDLLEAKAGPSLELRVRLLRLVNELEKGKPESWRRARALEVLERIGSADSVALLKKLGGGYAGSRQTREAKAALARLGR